MSGGITMDMVRTTKALLRRGLPSLVVDHALCTLVNICGCAIRGSQDDVFRKVAGIYISDDIDGRSRIIGHAGGAPAADAALLNGLSAAVNAFDDTHAETIVHPGPPVCAALIAACGELSQDVDGNHFLQCLAMGLEWTCRLSKAMSLPSECAIMGWSQTGTAGTVGAALACALLFDLDDLECCWAIGIAAAEASGLRVAHGSMAMHLAPAQAASMGLRAAMLARVGVSGPVNALDGRFGFLALFSREGSAHHLTEKFGERFDMLDILFKAYPCGIVIHAVIDACLALFRQVQDANQDVVRIDIEVPPAAVTLTDKPDPANVFEAQVSTQHWAACALLKGRAGIEEGQIKAVDDPQVAALRRQCRLISRNDLADDAAKVTVHLHGGHRLEHEIVHGLGSIANRLDRTGISSKFVRQTEGQGGQERAHILLTSLWSLRSVKNVGAIWSDLAFV